MLDTAGCAPYLKRNSQSKAIIDFPGRHYCYQMIEFHTAEEFVHDDDVTDYNFTTVADDVEVMIKMDACD